jgi:hypothetical protein
MPRIGLIPNVRLVEAIGSAYANAAAEIVVILRGLEPDTYTPTAGALATSRIRIIVDCLDLMAAGWARVSIKEAYDDSKAIAETRLEAIGAVKPKPRRWTRPVPDRHALTIDKYTRLTVKDYVRANRTILATAGKYLNVLAHAGKKLGEYREDAAVQAFSSAEIKKYLDEFIAKATAEHTPSQGLARSIMDQLLAILDGEDFIEINGRDYNLRSYSELVARTRMRDAATDATLNECAEYDNDLVEIPEHASVCEECIPHIGKVFSISGTSDTYPLLPDGGPPWHPNDFCYINPTSETALKWRNA